MFILNCGFVKSKLTTKHSRKYFMTQTLHAPLTKAGIRNAPAGPESVSLLYPSRNSKTKRRTLYQHISHLREQPGDSKKLVRPSTVRKIAESLGFQAAIDTRRNDNYASADWRSKEGEATRSLENTARENCRMAAQHW